ncbi:MAG: (deoxy)nucleoside triphosphate pyrophosphohydrolase [Pedosphaera sp.]|nr:(deoxy)nucleoside triphosphate pyrophosphohydrolase [Pedosphaera sp.]
MHPPIEVAAGLVFHSGKLLITQRRPGDHLGGLWEFPGGKREADESFEECLRRELREELAIEVSTGEMIDELIHAYPEKTVRLKFYRCELLHGSPRPLGCHAFVWVTRDQLDDYAFPAADLRLLDKLRTSQDLWAAG